MRNLREIAPTWYFNVPKGFEALLPYLRNDAQLRRTFFSRLKVLWYAGAGIGQHVFDEIRELALKTCGERILFLTGLGATETAPYAFGRTWDTEAANNIGLPPPGLEVKLVPAFGKLEAQAARPDRHAGLLAQPGAHRRGVRRRGLLPAGRRVSVRRSGRSAAEACSTRGASPRTSSCRAAPGSVSARCARS